MRTVTVIEGREKNFPLVDDLEKAAQKKGWGFSHIRKIDPVKIAKFDLCDYPLEHIIFRDLSENSFYETARLKRYIDKHKKIAINMDAVGGRASTSDKYFQHGLFLLDDELKNYVLPIFEVGQAQDVEELIKAGELKYPVVLKPRFGTAGRGMALARNRKELYSAYRGPKRGILAEQYIEADRDWRVFVIGGTAVCAMRKCGDMEHPENFVAWSGGKIRAKEEDPVVLKTLTRLACKAAEVSKLEYTGVDIIQDKRTKKFYVLETNFAAGWFNKVEEITGVSVPERLIEWLEDMEDAKGMTKKKAVKTYIEKRLDCLPRAVAEEYRKIMAGDKEALARNKKALDKYDCYKLEDIPLSWAGNFIGPDVGTLEEGAIISAVWTQELKNAKDS